MICGWLSHIHNFNSSFFITLFSSIVSMLLIYIKNFHAIFISIMPTGTIFFLTLGHFSPRMPSDSFNVN